MTTLNPRQELFVQKFLECGVATRAYIDAGYSPNGADRAASRLLGNVEVQARLRELREKSSRTIDLSQEGVAQAWLIIAKADPAAMLEAMLKAVDKNPDAQKMIQALTPLQRQAIKTIEISPEGGVKLTMFSKERALEAVSKIMGLYEDTNRVRNPVQALEDDQEFAEMEYVDIARKIGFIVDLAARIQEEAKEREQK